MRSAFRHGLSYCRHKGFTLVEMVTVTIILGILVIGVSSIILLGTRIFVDSTSVDQVLSQSRFAIERMTRELRNALPQSIRVRTDSVSYQCIEFVPIIASASYTQLAVVPDSASQTATVMLPANGISANDQMVVYPLSADDIYNADPDETVGRLFDIQSISANTITFERAVQFAEASPQLRYFMVNDAVSYCFESDGAVRRYQGYNKFNLTQPAPAQMGTGVLMAEGVANDIATQLPIHFTNATLLNNAVVQLTPIFNVNQQVFQYQHQVQVVNVP
ncbi:PilW family protein [Shewanella waksmanii]|uniref:PilW family protein n=1 Tax=Shewanella waksmanii TaxID=213783 RepID=UPI0037368F40